MSGEQDRGAPDAHGRIAHVLLVAPCGFGKSVWNGNPLAAEVDRRTSKALRRVQAAYARLAGASERSGVVEVLAAPAADAALELWYALEDARLIAAGGDQGSADRLCPAAARWLGDRGVLLTLPEYPPRYPVSWSGRYGSEAFRRAGARWRGLVAEALSTVEARRPRWVKAHVRFTFLVPPRSADPDGYSVRFVLNGLVEARVLLDDGPGHVSYTCRTRTVEGGLLGTVLHVRRLADESGGAGVDSPV